jgi:glycosyltransferase involved in cell wall biosynthesis|tara:strand:+ start:910 stop:1560 length:651 start_codon:yes stop_codon:yes gene_type:complete
MKLSFAITVCNESKDLYSLISFLKKVKRDDDEINILLDTLHTNETTRDVLKRFKDDIVLNERDFCGNFSVHRNFHLKRCKGDYIFIIDADEMPKELLINTIRKAIEEHAHDLFAIPRINIHPGSTQEWLDKHGFKVNEMDWINWPDYQSRVFKNDSKIFYENALHERVVGAVSPVFLKADPRIAIWHIKSIEKQDNRWEDGKYNIPDGKNFNDTLL